MVRIATLDDDGKLTPGQVPALATLGATATGEALIEAVDAAAARTALGMTAAGSAVATAADASAQRTALGLGTAAVAATGDFATAAQGALADTATQPGDLGGAAGLDVGTTAGTVAAGDDSRITGALAAANLDTAVTAVDANAASALRVQQDARLLSTYARVWAGTATGAASHVGGVNAYIQALIDGAAAAGGGTVRLGPGTYTLTRVDDDCAIRMASNVTLSGVGPATHLQLDPATVADAERYIVIRLGTASAGASYVTIQDLKVTGNHAAIGGGTVNGISAWHNLDKLAHSDHVTVRRCHIYDTQQAVSCSKSGGDAEMGDATRIAAQHYSWNVDDCVIDLCGNKAIEFSEASWCSARRNRITRTYAGPQAIFYSHDIVFEGNFVTFTDSGINLTAGAHDIDMIGNVVEADPTISVGVANGALFLRTEATTGWAYSCYNIRSRGNVWRDKYTSNKRVFKFRTETAVTSAEYSRISFVGDTFDGTIYFADPTAPAKTSITEVDFDGCTIEAGFTTVAAATHAAYSDVTVRGCRLRSGSGYTLNAAFEFAGSRLKSALTIAAGVTGAFVHGCRIVGGITDSGTSTTLADNYTG